MSGSSPTPCKIYQCSICQFSSCFELRVRQHQEEAHNNNYYYFSQLTTSQEEESSMSQMHFCTICEFKSTRASSLSNHNMNHNQVKKFGCSYCPFWSCYKKLIRTHEKECHSSQSWKKPKGSLQGGQGRIVIVNNKSSQNQQSPAAAAALGEAQVMMTGVINSGSSSSNLQREGGASLGNQVYTCNDCNFMTPVCSVFMSHQQTHRGKNINSMYKCFYCQYWSRDQRETVEHVNCCHRAEGDPGDNFSHPSAIIIVSPDPTTPPKEHESTTHADLPNIETMIDFKAAVESEMGAALDDASIDNIIRSITALDEQAGTKFKCKFCSFKSNDEKAVRGHEEENHQIVTPPSTPIVDELLRQIPKTYQCSSCSWSSQSIDEILQHELSFHTVGYVNGSMGVHGGSTDQSPAVIDGRTATAGSTTAYITGSSYSMGNYHPPQATHYKCSKCPYTSPNMSWLYFHNMYCKFEGSSSPAASNVLLNSNSKRPIEDPHNLDLMTQVTKRLKMQGSGGCPTQGGTCTEGVTPPGSYKNEAQLNINNTNQLCPAGSNTQCKNEEIINPKEQHYSYQAPVNAVPSSDMLMMSRGTSAEVRDNEDQFDGVDLEAIEPSLDFSQKEDDYEQPSTEGSGGETPRTCPICDLQVPQKAFSFHLRSHTPGRTFRCSLCEYSTRKEESLSKHLRGHSSPELQVRCSECPYWTDNHARLERHRAKYHPVEEAVEKFEFEVPDSFDDINIRSILNLDTPSDENYYANPPGDITNEHTDLIILPSSSKEQTSQAMRNVTDLRSQLDFTSWGVMNGGNGGGVSISQMIPYFLDQPKGVNLPLVHPQQQQQILSRPSSFPTLRSVLVVPGNNKGDERTKSKQQVISYTCSACSKKFTSLSRFKLHSKLQCSS